VTSRYQQHFQWLLKAITPTREVDVFSAPKK